MSKAETTRTGRLGKKELRHAAIVLSLDTTHIGWQVRFDPLPLLVVQPKQIPAHDPILS